jgi:hypothetical protein
VAGEVNVGFAETTEGLAQSLDDIPSLDYDVRRTVLGMLRQREYQLPDIDQHTGFTFWYKVIMAAAGQHGALQQLAKSVSLVDRSADVGRFQQEVSRLLPSEIFTLRQRFEFISFVRESVPAAKLNHYFRLATELATEELPGRDLQTAEELVSELEEILAPGPGHPLIRLTETIARVNGRRGNVKQAMAWSDRLAARLDQLGPERHERRWLQAHRKRGLSRPGSASPREPVTLVQVIEPSGAGKDRYLYRAWMYRDTSTREPEVISADDSARSLDGVRGQAVDALRQVIKRLGTNGGANIELEFFLPRHLLWYPVEDWDITQYASLGTHYVVVVRDLGRIQEPMLQPGWYRKWTCYTDDGAAGGPADGAAAAGTFGRWVTCADAPFEPGALTRELRADKCFAVALTFPPRPRGQHVDLAEALDAGTAIMLWPRQRCEHSAGAVAGKGNGCVGVFFQQEISRRLNGRRLADLPKVVWEIRKEQWPGDESGVVLLWDNPEHWPGVKEFRLDSPYPLEEA